MSMEKFKEKYKNVELSEASSFYYGTGNAMDRVLAEMQEGIDRAVELVDEMKEESEEEIHVDVYIDQENLKIQFFTSEYDEEEYVYGLNEKLFHEHIVGDAMAEAMVLMEMMGESGTSTGIRQAINNWVEDLDFEGFGEELGEDYDVSDSYGAVDY